MSHVEMREISVIEMMSFWLYLGLPSHQCSPKRGRPASRILKFFLDISMLDTKCQILTGQLKALAFLVIQTFYFVYKRVTSKCV